MYKQSSPNPVYAEIPKVQKNDLKVTPIPAFNDNYIWGIQVADSNQTLVVDPGEATPVQTWLRENQLKLAGILLTHHHQDHQGGVATLVEHWPEASVYAGEDERFPSIAIPCKAQDRIKPLKEIEFQVFFIPGHTRSHIAFYSAPHLFCGDTLFSAGCGRLFEGSPQQMHQSLAQLCQLPEETYCYPAHEYTQNNLRFAQLVEPENSDIQQYFAWTTEQREKNLPTLPTQLGLERKINPFLRTESSELRQQLRLKFAQSVEDNLSAFALTREWKDHL